MSPAGSQSGRRNALLTQRLANWAEMDGSGVLFDSSAGFTFPNRAIRAPDASWISRDRWDALDSARAIGVRTDLPRLRRRAAVEDRPAAISSAKR